jgi:hypothetical protein
MTGVNKKNKRGSSSSSSSSSLQQQQHSVSPTTELIERTPDNDYGVLSDPDEQPSHHQTFSPTSSSSEYEDHSHSSCQSERVDPPIDLEPLPVVVVALPLIPECSHILDEQSPTSHSSPQSSPHSSPQSPPLTRDQDLLISQTPTLNKSLETLKLKLTRDKNFSRKITLHTFFSYIILAMEIQQSCSSSIVKLSAENVQELVVHMIEHHTSNDSVKTYLHGLVDKGIVRHMIESIIEFNKDNQNSSHESLYTIEENELQKLLLQENTADDAATNAANAANAAAASNTNAATTNAVNIVVTDSSSDSSSEHISSQTPQKCSGFKRILRCFFSGCCG